MERLLYISQGKTPAAHLDNIQRVLDSGCKWVQLRLKDLSSAELFPYAGKAKKICDAHNALLSINDHPEVARDVDAFGLHLGLHDMEVQKAREIIGKPINIGGTANTFDDVKRRVKEGVDYIGLGPLHFTKTKRHLSPILNHSGVAEIMMLMQEAGFNTPVIVVGGVTEPDVKQLLKKGVFGIGVSSILSNASFPQEVMVKIKNDINEGITNS